ncbi:hypothetical protein P167DRAFT_523089 [Morchella conica CCBAS932]|uniref:Mannosyltransferase n=1 Tax=Morchella conica CCBAS932 TaxID=1392247 RepID=A0A3N4L3F7_9PEZI|nr:hypothetical protein P167DRAFT_523089 [Morchella conica CCBAS932]
MATPSPPPAVPRPKKRSFSLTSVVFFSILSFRIVNALTTRTFFQPDEYFQSLEPAWRMVFGEGWLTWEWRNQLRSIAHPLIFAGVYKVADFVSKVLKLRGETRAEVLVVAPKLLQAVFATLGDYFTAKLAGKLFGGAAGWTSLCLSLGSAFHYFCATRTFSNSLETSVTAMALCYWPWGLTKEAPKTKIGRALQGQIDRNDLRLSLLLAAFACILRPTNVLIWTCLGSILMYRSTPRDRATLVTEAVTVGVTAILLNAIADHRYYGAWTFPPLKFLQFNLLQSLSHFYGTNDWHYYLSQGLPLLLTSCLPLTLYALYKFLLTPESTAQHFAGKQLAATTVIVTAIYSLIAHKEVRFLYPLLPIMHVLSAAALESLPWSARAKRLAVWAVVLLNLPLAYYVTQAHQRGVIDVVDYLRHDANNWRSAGFLMPCHSTPWRANIQGDGELWALGCEPPIGMTVEEKKTYLDEADEFYADPAVWMAMNFPGVEMLKEDERAVKEEAKHKWPERLVFFQALEDTMVKYFEGVEGYEECWRGFNTHWHDDSRRVGDVVVWCLKKYA